MSAVSVRGLVAAYDRDPVLHEVDLELAAGTIGAVLGPSGSGKSTLLRVIAGLHRARRGTVEIGGRVVDDSRSVIPPEHRRVGLVPQSGALFPHLDVRGNIGYGLSRRSSTRPERRARVDELLELTGLVDLGDRMPHQVSGGQRQRVALARALAPRPDVVLLDEPFSALDASLRTSIRAEVRSILQQTFSTALLVTHDQSEALSFGDLLAVMRDGRIEQVDAPDVIYRSPASPWVGTFLGEANLVPAESNGHQADCVLGHLEHEPIPTPGAVQILVRPEQLRVTSEPTRRGVGVPRVGVPRVGVPRVGVPRVGVPRVGVASVGVAGVVVGRDFHGHDAVLTLEVGDQVVRARVTGRLLPEVGQPVRVAVAGLVRAFPSDSVDTGDTVDSNHRAIDRPGRRSR